MNWKSKFYSKICFFFFWNCIHISTPFTKRADHHFFFLMNTVDTVSLSLTVFQKIETVLSYIVSQRNIGIPISSCRESILSEKCTLLFSYDISGTSKYGCFKFWIVLILRWYWSSFCGSTLLICYGNSAPSEYGCLKFLIVQIVSSLWCSLYNSIHYIFFVQLFLRISNVFMWALVLVFLLIYFLLESSTEILVFKVAHINGFNNQC